MTCNGEEVASFPAVSKVSLVACTVYVTFQFIEIARATLTSRGTDLSPRSAVEAGGDYFLRQELGLLSVLLLERLGKALLFDKLFSWCGNDGGWNCCTFIRSSTCLSGGVLL